MLKTIGDKELSCFRGAAGKQAQQLSAACLESLGDAGISAARITSSKKGWDFGAI